MKLISREQAKARGLKRFFTGKLCRNGHIAERLTRKSRCVICAEESRKREDPRYQAYWSKRGNAKERGIPFLFTFEEWWAVWEKSGKWHLRGRHRGGYVMARYFDRGGYEKGNVRIIPNTVNIYLETKGRKASAATRAKLSAMRRGKKRSPQIIAKVTAARWGDKQDKQDRLDKKENDYDASIRYFIHPDGCVSFK
jgi:hypothetical protein